MEDLCLILPLPSLPLSLCLIVSICGHLLAAETNSPNLRHTSHQEENTGLLIGFLLIKEMWQIRFFGGSLICM